VPAKQVTLSRTVKNARKPGFFEAEYQKNAQNRVVFNKRSALRLLTRDRPEPFNWPKIREGLTDRSVIPATPRMTEGDAKSVPPPKSGRL